MHAWGSMSNRARCMPAPAGVEGDRTALASLHPHQQEDARDVRAQAQELLHYDAAHEPRPACARTHHGPSTSTAYNGPARILRPGPPRAGFPGPILPVGANIAPGRAGAPVMKTVAPEKAALTDTASAPASGHGSAGCRHPASGPARPPDTLLAGVRSPGVSLPESAPTCIARGGPRPLV